VAEPVIRQAGGPVVFVGVATTDVIALVDRYPGADERVLAEAITHAGGGPAGTAAVACARLGVAAAFVGAIAEDAAGEAILDGLRVAGVDTSAALRVPGNSGGSMVVVDRSRGTRAICNRPGPALHIPQTSAAAALIRGAAWVHADHFGCAPLMRLVAPVARAARPRISLDAGNAVPGLTLEWIDLYVPTLARLAADYGPASVAALLGQARAAGAGAVVATDGARGAYALDREGRAHAVDALRIDVLSTLGAGDVFHGALLAGLIHFGTVAQALPYAAIAAALSCRALDGRSGIPGDAEVRALLPRLPCRPLAEEIAKETP
jgi:sulfofructose kinase